MVLSQLTLVFCNLFSAQQRSFLPFEKTKVMTKELSKDQLMSVRDSYFNILALFLEQEKIESRYIRCLLKWAVQLRLDPEEIGKTKDMATLSFSLDRVDKLEAVYHLVHMIYLDRVVEDVELEVATIYAQKLGFKAEIVSELFTSIVTNDVDRISHADVRGEVIEFLNLHKENL